MAISNVLTDTFTRTSSSGWGSADTGQTYSFTGAGGTVTASDTTVTSGHGVHSVPATTAFRQNFAASLVLADVDAKVTGSVGAVPGGAPVEVANLTLRGTGTGPTNGYLFRVQIEPTAAVTAIIFDRSGNNLAQATVPGVTYTANMQLTVRAQAVGTTLRMRVWQASGTEPVRWLLSTRDTAFTGAGWVSVRSGVASGNTDTKPVVFTYDNFTVGAPVASYGDFPDEDLPIQLLAAFGADLTADPYTWQYTDLSDRLLEDAAQISHGRSDGASQAQPASLSCVLDNLDGYLTRGHPLSPYWPYVRKNTPILFQLDPDTFAESVLFDGYASGWTPGWGTWTQKPTVTLTAAGSLQRLKQGTDPLDSPLRRATIAAKPVAYHPLEDSGGATQLASGLPAAPPIAVVAGTLTLANNGDLPGSKSLPTLTASSQLANTTQHVFANHWQVDWYLQIPGDKLDDDTGGDIQLMVVGVPNGTVDLWEYVIGNDGNPYQAVHGYDSTGSQVVDSGHFAIDDWTLGSWFHLRLMAQKSGSNISWVFDSFPLNGPEGSTFGGTIAGTVGDATTWLVPAQDGIDGISIGHVAIYDNFDFGTKGETANGWVNESASARILRLCTEQGVPVNIIGTSTVMMGVQSSATFANLLQECEDADGGQFYDGVSPGLTYVTRIARENIPSRMLVDYSAINVTSAVSDTQVLVPTDDDQQTHNRWVVSRDNGSSAVYEDTDGPQGVNAVNEYESSTSLNITDDTVLPDEAAWRVHLGTVDALRYPTVNFDFAANPDQLPAWLGLGLLERFTETNLPPQYPPFDVELVIVGRRQTVSRRAWTVAANCEPFDPWRVIVLATDIGDTGDFIEHLDTDDTELGSSVSVGATSLSLKVNSGPLWTTVADDFPLYLAIAGIKVKVTSITGASSPQTAAVDGSTVIKALSAGTAVNVWDPPVLGL